MATNNILTRNQDVFNQIVDKDNDFLRSLLKSTVKNLVEEEVAVLIGAGRYERSEERSNSRNGTRDISIHTRVGELPVAIPKLRKGSYYPSFLEPRRPWEHALVNVIQEAYVHGVSTRKMDDVVRSLGLDGIDKSAVSRIAKGIDESVDNFRHRPLEGRYPYIWLDATYPKARNDGRVVGMASVIAVAVTEDGERTVVGVDAGLSEDAAFWMGFLRSLVSRGLTGVKMVVSDAHEGLRKAIAAVFPGASWQRCRVHFMRNVLCRIPKHSQSLVAAMVKTVYLQPDQESARLQANNVVEQLCKRFPQAMKILDDGVMDSLSYMAFPKEQWTQLHSTNLLERLNREVRRRTNVVSIFPNREALIRLVSAILMEVDDEWKCADKRYFSLSSMKKVPGYEDRINPLLMP
jgi:transposase-like protein